MPLPLPWSLGFGFAVLLRDLYFGLKEGGRMAFIGAGKRVRGARMFGAGLGLVGFERPSKVCRTCR